MNSLSEVNVQQRLDNIETDVSAISGAISSSRIATDNIIRDVNFTTSQTDNISVVNSDANFPTAMFNLAGSGNVKCDLNQLRGNAIARNAGVVGNDVVRVCLANDDTNTANWSSTHNTLSSTAPTRGLLCGALENISGSIEALQVDTSDQLLTNDQILTNISGGGLEKRILSSFDRNNGSGEAPEFSLSTALDGTYIATGFAMHNNMYNVNDTNNKIQYRVDDTTTYNVTLTNGFYLPSELGEEIVAVMIGGAGTVTCTYDSKTHKFTIAVATVYTTYKFLWNALANSAHKLLGYDVDTDTTDVASHESENAIMLAPNDIFYISASVGTTGYRASNDSTYAFACTMGYDDAGFGSVTYCNVKGRIAWSSVTALTLTLKDFQGNTIDNAGCDWHIELLKIS